MGSCGVWCTACGNCLGYGARSWLAGFESCGDRDVSGYAGPARVSADNAPPEQWEVVIPSLGISVSTAGGGGIKPSHHSGTEEPFTRLSVAKVESLASPPVQACRLCGV
jgi:hypothetical protein